MNASVNVTTQSGVLVVVDDDAAVRNSLRFSLEVEGFVVQTYARGEELLSGTALSACRCLVIDQKLSGISGIDLIEKIRGRNLKTPAVLITTDPSEELKLRAANAGIGIIEKPLLDSGLLDGIRRAMTSATIMQH